MTISHTYFNKLENIIKKTGYDGKIVNEYKLQNKVGDGGFSFCYLVKEVKTQEKYVIKVIPKALGNDIIKSLESEFIIHSKISHKNIVKFYEKFEDNNFIYILLEYCVNNSLYNYIKDKGNKLPEEEAHKYLKQICEGIEYIHNKNIIHHDLKLHNILLDADMNVKICDFGLSLQVFEDEDYKVNFYHSSGTPNYRAPETFDKTKPYGREIDIWAIGCMYYSMIYGKTPFETKTLRETNHKICKGNYTNPKSIIITKQGKAFIGSLLTVDRHKRPNITIIQDMDYIKNDFSSIDGVFKLKLPGMCDYTIKAPGYELWDIEKTDANTIIKWKPESGYTNLPVGFLDNIKIKTFKERYIETDELSCVYIIGYSPEFGYSQIMYKMKINAITAKTLTIGYPGYDWGDKIPEGLAGRYTLIGDNFVGGGVRSGFVIKFKL